MLRMPRRPSRPGRPSSAQPPSVHAPQPVQLSDPAAAHRRTSEPEPRSRSASSERAAHRGHQGPPSHPTRGWPGAQAAAIPPVSQHHPRTRLLRPHPAGEAVPGPQAPGLGSRPLPGSVLPGRSATPLCRPRSGSPRRGRQPRQRRRSPPAAEGPHRCHRSVPPPLRRPRRRSPPHRLWTPPTRRKAAPARFQPGAVTAGWGFPIDPPDEGPPAKGAPPWCRPPFGWRAARMVAMAATVITPPAPSPATTSATTASTDCPVRADQRDAKSRMSISNLGGMAVVVAGGTDQPGSPPGSIGAASSAGWAATGAAGDASPTTAGPEKLDPVALSGCGRGCGIGWVGPGDGVVASPTGVGVGVGAGVGASGLIWSARSASASMKAWFTASIESTSDLAHRSPERSNRSETERFAR